MKGADAVMRTLVQYNDWLDEESSNMAREGLRTLVVARRVLTQQQFAKRLGVALVTLSKWENGHSQPSALAVAQIQGLKNNLEKKSAKETTTQVWARFGAALEEVMRLGLVRTTLSGDVQNPAAVSHTNLRRMQVTIEVDDA